MARDHLWPRAKQVTMFSLYIHIPFCVKKCNYCDFLSFSASDELKDQYVLALCNEIKLYSKVLPRESKDIYTIFFGGGTPSLLTPKQLNRIMETIAGGFSVTDGAEVSLECNPGTATEDKLRSFRESGINRLSIGLQSANDRELKILGRIHDYADFNATFEAARRVGYRNLNVDIISAVPGQSPESYKRTLTEIVNHDPEHISAYSLIIEEGTKFRDLYGHDTNVNDSLSDSPHRPDDNISENQAWDIEVNIKSKISENMSDFPPLPNEDDERRMYYDTADILARLGYHRYEISNYSKDGYECRHNKVYWTGGEYIGTGLGASSYLSGYRYKNPEDMKTYLSLYEKEGAGHVPDKPFPDIEGLILSEGLHEETAKLTAKDKMEEYMFLGLRLTEGISLNKFKEIFGVSFDSIYGDTAGKLASLGLIVRDGDFLRLTDKGIDVSNTVLSNFLLD